MGTRDENEAREVFADRYAIERGEVNRRIERLVIGGDWGANGYTTMAQANELGELVGAAPDKRLLDVGAGRGWPGLYLAASTGCSVVLSDLPVEGLRSARKRAVTEGMGERAGAVVASASRLPFGNKVFDAVVSTDVFC